MEQKLHTSFYILSAFIALLIYLSYHLFYSPIFLKVQPYILSIYFIAYSLIVYNKTKSLTIGKYIPVVILYVLFFGCTLLFNSFNGKPSAFWLLELVLQLSISGTATLIGYGLVYIFSRLRNK